MRRAPWVGVVLGGVALLIGAFIDPAHAAQAYLVTYLWFVGIVLGALAMVMIAQLTTANWFLVVQPFALRVTRLLPLTAVLFIPVLVSLRLLYPWTAAGPLPDAVRAKAGYLNVPFFVVRAAFYFGTWILLGQLLRRPLARASITDINDSGSAYTTSAWGIVVFGLTITFAAFDWMMSLDPQWYSTIFGVYYFAGGLLGALALLAVLSHIGGVVDKEHLHAIGKLLFTFAMFWAYIAYAQLIVIWSGDVPAEVRWYVSRLSGSWGILGLIMLAAQFAVPFLFLLLRAVKRSSIAMGGIGALVLVAQYANTYWMVIPTFRPAGFHPQWLDAAALLLAFGLILMVPGDQPRQI